MFYVYEHLRNDTGEVFYVGKGKNNRISDKRNRNSSWNAVVCQTEFTQNIIFETDCEELALFVEQECIYKHRQMNVPLVNKTSGGQGISGYRHTAEAKKKMGDARRGKPGVVPSKEHIEKLRAMNTGVKFSEERRKKISEKAKGRKMPDHVRKLLQERMKDFQHTPEMIEHLRQVNIGRKHTPETIAKMCAIQQNMPKKTCPHCGLECSAGNAGQWHFDKCKHKENDNG